MTEPADAPRGSLIEALRRRKLAQWALAYAASSWIVLQVLSLVAGTYHWPDAVMQVAVGAALLGFLVALVLAWYHGERGAQRVTGTELALVALLLAAGGAVLWRVARAPEQAAGTSAAAAAAAHDEKSIAVLPFADLSPSHDQEYFSDGMAEELLDALAKVPGLKVAGRTSSFYFKGRNEPLERIGAALGVAHVLEGSVRKQGERVRVTAQLIQTRDGFHLWSQSYDGDLSDVFVLQERIAGEITRALKLVLDRSPERRTATPSATAHEQMLRGRFLFLQRGRENLLAAIDSFQAALASEPNYADAWAGLAQVYVVLPIYPAASVDPPGDTQRLYGNAFEAAERALALEPESSAALAARATVRYIARFDWRGAEEDFRTAIGANSRDVTARQWYAELLLAERRWEESEAQYAAALAIDPLAAVVIFSRGSLRMFQGQNEAAVAAFDAALQLSPRLQPARDAKVGALAALQRYDEALALAEDRPEPERSLVRSIIAARRDPALRPEAVRRILADDRASIVFKPNHLAEIGEYALALDELEREFDAESPFRELTWCLPSFAPLHDEPRFKALLARINLPPAPEPGQAGHRP